MQRKRQISLTPDQKVTRRYRALMRFKGIVHSVMANLYWLTDMEDNRIGSDTMKNISLLKRKKFKKSSLSVKEKSVLCKQKEERTEEEKNLLSKVIGGLKCFRRYPPNVKKELAAVTYFVYFGPERVIVKQDDEPLAMYFVLSGEASVTVGRFDSLLNEYVEEQAGVMGPGTMFGEVALIHGIERLATITTETPCELLMIKKEDFDKVLKSTVLKAWEDIQKILTEFSYFKNWDPVTKRECSIISRTKAFVEEDTVKSKNDGLDNYACLITQGSCVVLECLTLKVYTANGKKKYKLANRNTKGYVNVFDEELTGKRFSKMVISGISKISLSQVSKTTLQRLHASMGNVTIKTEPSAYDARDFLPGIKDDSAETERFGIDYYIETHFIKVCDLRKGACFNLGESMERRRVVATSPTRILLIPKHFIWKNNKDNVWSRMRQFLISHIPNTERTFQRFLDEMKFINYRKALMNDIWKKRKIPTNNNLLNIPYSIRITEGVEEYYNL